MNSVTYIIAVAYYAPGNRHVDIGTGDIKVFFHVSLAGPLRKTT